MRTSLLFILALAACGSSGSKHGPDASQQIDAPGTLVDAPNAAAMGLGAVCSQTMMCPTTGATMCAALSMTATHGFCTLSCGMTASTATQPPTNGNQMCAASTPAPPSGTPVCAIHGPAMNNKFTWYCAVACGTLNNQDLGQCPGGLTCMSNICQ